MRSFTGRLSLVSLVFFASLPAAAASSVALSGCGSHSAQPVQTALRNPVQASAPFQDFQQTRIAVGSKCVHVLVANTTNERSQGLRAVNALPGYSGMLFVFQTDTQVSFTMSETLIPLDIGFYNVHGQQVDHMRMTPCTGTDATCPLYTSHAKFRYALETPTGKLLKGGLRACKKN